MAVVNIKEKASGDTAGTSGEGQHSATRAWTVLCDDHENDTSITAKQAEGIPRYQDSHPNDPFLRVQTIRSKRSGSSLLFEVTVTYGQLDPGEGGGDNSNPLDSGPVRRWSFASRSEPVDVTDGGKPIVNSAGESFDPPVCEEKYDLVLTITRNQATFDEKAYEEYRGATNKEPFMGFEVGECMMANISGEEVVQGDFIYWRVTFEIHIRREATAEGTIIGGWKRRVLDQGFRTFFENDDDGKPIYTNILDSNGQPITAPALLDGDGQKLANGAAAKFLEFRTRPSETYSDLGLE